MYSVFSLHLLQGFIELPVEVIVLRILVAHNILSHLLYLFFGNHIRQIDADLVNWILHNKVFKTHFKIIVKILFLFFYVFWCFFSCCSRWGIVSGRLRWLADCLFLSFNSCRWVTLHPGWQRGIGIFWSLLLQLRFWWAVSPFSLYNIRNWFILVGFSLLWSRKFSPYGLWLLVALFFDSIVKLLYWILLSLAVLTVSVSVISIY